MTLNEYLKSALKDEKIMEKYIEYLKSQKYTNDQILTLLWHLDNGTFPLLEDTEDFLDLTDTHLQKYQYVKCNCGQRLTGCINNIGNCGM